MGSAQKDKKKCLQCKRSKGLKNFKLVKGEHIDTCITCKQKNAREVQTRKIRKLEGSKVSHLIGDLKWCGAWDTVHVINEFKKGQKYKDGHAAKCSMCVEGNKPIMTKVELAVFRSGKAKSIADKAEETLNDAAGRINETMGEAVEKAMPDFSKVSEIVEDVKETKEEVIGFWKRIKAIWKGWF